MINSYYKDNDPIFTNSSCTVLERLKRELADKQYFKDEIYRMYLEENGLDPEQLYNKDTMQKALLQSVLDVLQSVSRNVDLMRSVETEFSTTSQAVEHLRNIINDLNKKILSVPDTPSETKSCISYLFRD